MMMTRLPRPERERDRTAVAFSLLILFCLSSQQSRAQLLKVDINAANPARSDTTAPGYAAWNVAVDLASSPPASYQQVSRVFTNAASNLVSCTIALKVPPIGDPSSALRADWLNKNGASTSTDPNVGYRLSFDGVWPVSGTPPGSGTPPYTNGGAMTLTISNLSAGVHTITTFHNDIWGTNAGQTWIDPANPYLSKCIVSVGGIPVFTNTPSFVATNDSKCGFAFFTITNDCDGQPVVLSFDPDHSSYADFVILNGFVIDNPSSPGATAIGPVPGDGDEHVFAHNDDPLPGSAVAGYTTLSWTPSQSALSHDVYLGTSSNAVAAATHASPEFKGNQPTNTWFATNLDSRLTYYWRIDEVATGGTSKGFVWRFQTRHLAFPGAEGYGRFARGGRGGKIVEVTNLNDSGPGSLRAALTNDIGPRTIVFAVSGLITLESRLTINQSHITIAGQTAPGKGICLRKWPMGLSGARDIVIRDIRSRPGNISGSTVDGMGMQGSDYCIFDHCSISWSIDEAFSSREAHNITLQRTLISEALNDAGHQNYPPGTYHGYAASIGGDIGSFHHNLLAHCYGRNWSLAGGLDAAGYFKGRLDIRDNVVYNWGHRATDGGAHEVNFVNNYYKPGPATDWFYALNAQYDNFPGTQQYYFIGNVMPGHFNESNQAAGRIATGSNGGSVPTTYSPWVDTPFFDSFVDTQSAGHALKLVLSDVGCNEPALDDHDARVIRESRDGTWTYSGSATGLPGMPDSQDDVGGWENYPEIHRPSNFDSDHDGLPDWWELLHGLNPNSPPGDFSDSNGDPDRDGYLNLDDYLDWLAAPHVDCVRNASVNVDLSQYTRGFTNNPVFLVASPAQGTVALLGDDKTAQFTPTSGFYGLGQFQFTVTDAQGSSLTNTVGVRVMALPTSQLAIDYPGGAPRLLFSGEAGFHFGLQYSDDLSTWTTWTNITATASSQTFPLPVSPGQPQRFYRAVSVE